MITLERGTTRLRMMDPRAPEPYYRGTRFDRTGIILSLDTAGHRYVQPWQRRYDPCSHDAVSGPAEEFLPVMRALSAGILKIGVGLLRDDGQPYDRFKLYEVLDPGRMTVTLGQSAGFQQSLNGHYDYIKTVELPADGRLRIAHALTNRSALPLDTYVYCHNFFILDGAPTGRATRFEFPWRPIGDWRAPYDSVRLTERGIAFERDLAPDETVFMGNLRPTPQVRDGYRFTLRNEDNGLSVEAACDRPMEYAVFWSNADVSCLEPYLPLHLDPGQTAHWTLDYRFR